MKYFDTGTILVIVIVKGFTHDLLLEAGVFLVSVKLILMSYKNGLNHIELQKDLQEIKKLLEKGYRK